MAKEKQPVVTDFQSGKPLSQPKANSKPTGLFITDEELTQLDGIIDQIPTAYGKRILQFFGLVHQKRAAEKANQTNDTKEA